MPGAGAPLRAASSWCRSMLISSSYLSIGSSVSRGTWTSLLGGEGEGGALLLESHMSLLHAIDLFTDELHLADLSGY